VPGVALLILCSSAQAQLLLQRLVSLQVCVPQQQAVVCPPLSSLVLQPIVHSCLPTTAPCVMYACWCNRKHSFYKLDTCKPLPPV